MIRFSRICTLMVSIGAALTAVGAARGGDDPAPFVSSYLRNELASSTEDFPGVTALSENGTAVGAREFNVPARWVNGKLQWSDDKLRGAATCVSGDGAWLAGDTEDFTVFRKHGDDAVEALPLLDFGKGAHPSGDATGIRSDGTTVGTCMVAIGEAAVEHAVIWTPEGQIQRLLPNTPLSWAWDTNEAGAIVGSYKTTFDAPLHAFLIDEGQVLDPTEGAEGSSAATAISPNGLIAGTLERGQEERYWFLNRGGQLTLIPLAAGDSGSPTAVNDSGLIVGNTRNEGPIAWLNGRFFRLNDLRQHGDETALVFAADLNNSGQIAANGYRRVGFISEHFSANVLEPVHAGPDLQGTLENVRVRSVGEPGQRIYRVQGTLKVLNAGTTRAGASVAGVLLPPAPITERRPSRKGQLRVSALPPGGVQRLRFDVAITGAGGPVQVQIQLDQTGRVAETNESNNLVRANR